MINRSITRSGWLVGVASLLLLSGCGGGTTESASIPTESGFAAIQVETKKSVGDIFMFATSGALSSITLERADGADIDAETTILISEWVCKTSDNQSLLTPVATSEVSRLNITSPAKTVIIPDLRVPSATLLVEIFNGNSFYYARRHDMASVGNLAITLNVAPASEVEMNRQFDKCP